jgi:uncharacterized OB-fold protein
MPQPDSVQAAQGLFADTSEGPRLLGSRCASCTTAYFPRAIGCHNPDCDESKMEDARFGPRGKLWSVSIANYPAPAPVVNPDPYVPFAVGLVDLPDGLRVLGRMLSDDPEGIEVGCEVELVLAPLGHDESGAEVISWQFRPL